MGIRNKVTGEMYTITSYDPVTGDITGINNTIGNTDLGDASNVYIGGGAPGEILSTDGAGNLSWISPSAGSPNSISSGTTTVDIPLANGNVVVTVAGTDEWVFGSDGNLTLPADGLLVVSGGIVGGGASPAPYLSGFSSVTAQTLSASGNITAGNIDITGSNLNWSNASIVQTGNADINITGDGVVTLRSLDGVYQWTFDTDGILNAPGNIATSGNVSANYFIGDGSQLTGISASTGDITFVNTTISAPNGDDIVVQALNDDGVVGSSLEMSPNDTLIRLEQWSEQDSQSFTTADWATGVYTTQGGGSIGAVEFTGAATIVDFVNSLVGVGQIYFSVNGGPLLVWDGSSAGPTNITFLTPTLPDTDPTTVTSFEYFYSYKSGFEIDYDDQEITIYANDADIILETNQGDIQLSSSGDISVSGDGIVELINYSDASFVAITTDANDASPNQWRFDVAGNLILAGGNSVIQSIANSSSEPLYPNVSTMVFTPDALLSSQSLVLDPTGPSHIHLRAPGANIDEPDANIFLGGEESSFEVGYYNGNVPNLYIHSGGNTWTFDNAGNLTTPSNLVIGPGPGSGSSIFQYNEGLQILGEGANSVVQMGWTANTSAPDSVTTIAMNYPGGGEGNVLIAVGNNATTVNYWLFDNTGNLRLPGNTFAVNYANNTQIDIVTKFEGSWTVPTGNSTQSFTVDGNNTYQMWVEGNIPNGIIVWNALVTITNNNVPVLGQQFAWNYEDGGSPLLLTSIPDQIIGTAGAISNAAPVVANTNVFTFGINNTSGSSQTVQYGWIRIS